MQKENVSRRIGIVVASMVVATTVTACGGSDNGSPPAAAVASNTPPDTAAASVGGFIAYLKVLTATLPDTTQPLDVSSFVAPTDDVGPFDTTI